jgi:hypothetical protein
MSIREEPEAFRDRLPDFDQHLAREAFAAPAGGLPAPAGGSRL